MFAGRNLAELLPASFVGLIDQRAAVQVKTIEEIKRERNFTRRRFNAVDAPEAAHEILERKRPAVGAGRDNLSVKDERFAAQFVARDFTDVRQAFRHFSQAPAPDAYLLALFVDLHARAVVFVFESRHSFVSFEDLIEVFGKLGQRRQERNEKFYVDSLQAGRAFGQGDRCHLREIGEKQSGAADVFEPAVRSAGDRFLDKSIVQPDPQLVLQEAE